MSIDGLFIAFLIIGIGTQVNFGGNTFLLENIFIYEKLTKCLNYTQSPEKYLSPNFGGQMPPPLPPPFPISYALPMFLISAVRIVFLTII